MNRLTTAHVAAALALALSLACGQAPDSATSAETPRASALRTTALSDSFNAYDSSTWEMANWANGNPFQVGWLPSHATVANGVLQLPEVEYLRYYESWGSEQTYPHMAVPWACSPFTAPSSRRSQASAYSTGCRCSPPPTTTPSCARAFPVL